MIAVSLSALALVVIAIKLIVSYYSLSFALVTGDYGRHLARFVEVDGLTAADTVGFARQLNVLPPSDCVFVVGGVSTINYLSMRRQPTRFYYFLELDSIDSSLPLRERWVDLWERDLQAADCRYVLVARRVFTNFHGTGPSGGRAA